MTTNNDTPQTFGEGAREDAYDTTGTSGRERPRPDPTGVVGLGRSNPTAGADGYPQPSFGAAV